MIPHSPHQESPRIYVKNSLLLYYKDISANRRLTCVRLVKAQMDIRHAHLTLLLSFVSLFPILIFV